MEQVRCVVIGYGGMGSQYVEYIAGGEIKGMLLTGVCCRNSKGRQEIQQRYPDISIYQDTDAMFANREELDAIVIATPHDTHIAIAAQALERGIYVLCDKPLGVTALEIRQLLEAEKRSYADLAVMYNLRSKGVFQKAKEMLTGGHMGRVTRAVWLCNTWYRSPAYHNSASWRSSWNGEHGGLLINQCQHYLDLWQWLLGMPSTVCATIDFGKYNDFLVDDCVELQLQYEDGLRGTFISSSGEHPGTNRFEIWGDKGKLLIEDAQRLYLDENEILLTEFSKTNLEVYGSPSHEFQEIVVPEEKNQYCVLLQNFANHILKGAELMASGLEGLKSVELANASYMSAWQEKKVTLPIDDQLYVDLLKQHENEEAAHII